MHFQTFGVSEPRFELEGLRFVTVKSRALGQRADLTLASVPGAPNAGGLPLVILLHGVYGSHWGWALQGGAHRTLRRLVESGAIPNMVLAMPSDGLWGDGSGYLNHGTQDFERWIVQEVPGAAAQACGSVSSTSPRFLAGLSMGGFGALRLGAKYPERFQAISGHSSITHFKQLARFVVESLDSYHAPAEDQSVLETMLRNRDRLPPCRFDCGTEDPLLDENRALHRELERHGVPHEYEEFPGGHEWAYWEAHLEDSLRFFARHLQPPTGQPPAANA